MQAMRRRMGKADDEHGAAGGGPHPVLRRLAQNLGAIGIGQNEPRVLGNDLDGHALGNREKELVAKWAR